MLTAEEKALIEILTATELEETAIIGTMLFLKEKKIGANLLIELLRQVERNDITEEFLINKIEELSTQ